jgi:hypothetical protein
MARTERRDSARFGRVTRARAWFRPSAHHGRWRRLTLRGPRGTVLGRTQPRATRRAPHPHRQRECHPFHNHSSVLAATARPRIIRRVRRQRHVRPRSPSLLLHVITQTTVIIPARFCVSGRLRWAQPRTTCRAPQPHREQKRDPFHFAFGFTGLRAGGSWVNLVNNLLERAIRPSSLLAIGSQPIRLNRLGRVLRNRLALEDATTRNP